MTSQEKIDFMEQYRGAGKEIDRLKDEINRWRSIAEKVTPSLSPVPPSTAGGGRMEAAVEHIDALQKELFEKIVKLTDLRRAIGQAIENLEDGRFRMLLRYHYIDGLTLEKTAEKMDYSPEWVSRSLHPEAISKIIL